MIDRIATLNAPSATVPPTGPKELKHETTWTGRYGELRCPRYRRSASRPPFWGAGAGSAVASPASGGANPIVRIDDGLVRGADVAGLDSFLGLPHAAPPTGNLRARTNTDAASAPLLAGSVVLDIPNVFFLQIFTQDDR
jgi:Carboxylesterase family